MADDAIGRMMNLDAPGFLLSAIPIYEIWKPSITTAGQLLIRDVLFLKSDDENSIGGNRFAPHFQSLVYRQYRRSKVRALDDGHHAVLHPFAIQQSLTTPVRFQYP